MKIFIGTDHAGFELKEKLKKHLKTQEHEIVDCGAHTYQKTDDYPDFIAEAAKEVSKNTDALGVVLGYSGAGECIVANKINGIRAFLAVSEENVRLAKAHNNANIISFGAHFTDEKTAVKLLNLFLSTPFSAEERHKRRINKITKLENEA